MSVQKVSLRGKICCFLLSILILIAFTPKIAFGQGASFVGINDETVESGTKVDLMKGVSVEGASQQLDVRITDVKSTDTGYAFKEGDDRTDGR